MGGLIRVLAVPAHFIGSIMRFNSGYGVIDGEGRPAYACLAKNINLGFTAGGTGLGIDL